MHAEIELVARHVFAICQRQHEYLKSKPTPYLEELAHRCEDRQPGSEASTLVAQEINKAVCLRILEQRSTIITQTKEP